MEATRQRIGPQRAAKSQAVKVLRQSSLELEDDPDDDSIAAYYGGGHQGRGKQRRSAGGAHERTDVSPSGRARSPEEEEAVINAIKDENVKLNAMKRFKNRIAARKSREGKHKQMEHLQTLNQELATRNRELLARIRKTERELRVREQQSSAAQKELYECIDELFSKLKEARAQATAAGQPLDGFELFEEYAQMGACDAPLPVSPAHDLSPSPIERDRSHSDLDVSPAAQAEFLFAAPDEEPHYGVVGLDHYHSSGPQQKSWLDDDLEGAGFDADGETDDRDDTSASKDVAMCT